MVAIIQIFDSIVHQYNSTQGLEEQLCLPIMLCWVPRCEETKFLCAVCMCFIQCCLLQEVLTEHVCAIGVQWGFNVVGGMTSLFPMEKSCLFVCFEH